MKRLWALLVIMTLASQATAQVTGPPQHDPFSPDMWFGVNFSGTTNWPPESDDFWGNGRYFRVSSSPYPPYAITNWFQFSIVLPAEAQEGWLLQKEADGSFTTITNLILSGDSGAYYLSQTWDLTTNQIHQLVAGNWYAEVDFGNSNSIGNLAPQGWQGPFVGFPDAYGAHSLWNYYAISPNNRTAEVVFDGSHCQDEFYLPIQCVWSAQTAGSSKPLTITNLMTTNIFGLGYQTGTLQMSDGVVSASPVEVYFQVITAGQAVDMAIAALPISGVSPNQRKVMAGILLTAAVEFKRGRMAQGCCQLAAFERFVAASHLSGDITAQLLRPAQDILAVFNQPQHRR
jgi:hypothetical protein